VREVREVPGGVEVDTDDGPLRAAAVLGAGGHGCPVARALGAVSDDEDVVVTQESETRVGAARLRALTQRHGCPELIAEPDFKGYGWYFTKGDFLNVGVGALGGMPIRRRLERLLERLRASGRLPADVGLAPFRGHAYAIRRGRPRRLAGPGFALVGDAAGLARDFSGEGIGPAVRSGVLAASALVDGGLGTYTERIRAVFGSPGGLVARLARHVPDAAIVAAARLACTRPGLRRRLVLEGAFGIG
jgi:flavin-dependent dehydrogenase